MTDGYDEGLADAETGGITRHLDVEQACEIMHDAYEKAAVGAGWETNPASRKPWADVPAANKTTMRAAVGTLLEACEIMHDGSDVYSVGLLRDIQAGRRFPDDHRVPGRPSSPPHGRGDAVSDDRLPPGVTLAVWIGVVFVSWTPIIALVWWWRT